MPAESCHYFHFSAQIVQGVKEAAVACEEEQKQMIKNSRKDEIEALEHEILEIRFSPFLTVLLLSMYGCMYGTYIVSFDILKMDKKRMHGPNFFCGSSQSKGVFHAQTM